MGADKAKDCPAMVRVEGGIPYCSDKQAACDGCRREQLKPCPFCGCEAVKSHKRGLLTWIVECSNQSCPASYMIGNRFESELEAIAAWNQRTEEN